MSSSALVVGGTGPTGPFLVRGLRDRGFRVSILHRGTHEVDEIDADVEHIHTDPFDGEATAAALGDRRFDLAIVTYGRLRALAELLAPRVGRFLSVGGAPAYRGFMDPMAYSPAGLPTPLGEDAALVADAAESRKGHSIVRTERQVFALRPDATHFRYPYVYGPRQPMPREWCMVRRMRDRRPFLVVPDGGLTLCTFGYSENLAHAVLLAVDAPEASAGQIYNCGDAESLSLRQVIETLAAALDWKGELVSMPWELALPARPLVMQPMTTHRLLDLGKIRAELGYRDVVAPADALVRTAAWLLENPPEPGGLEETVLQDPFDYAAEDRLVRGWTAALADLPDPAFEREPGYTLSWEGTSRDT
ncbi:MAG: NAD-dependent epimerase/dehydratase family protein [Proteobacteria bacterium]|nr:NAD-dependent epimerase/dehydratase family protein [Pseudomonadota bacterium]